MFVIPSSKQQSAAWSGGKTTQLYIYPVDANYAERNFLFRVSTATVETETSTFTVLPGFKRILMILNGTLNIEHKSQYTKKLSRFDKDHFDGSWETTATGRVTDFNLMFAAHLKGECSVLSIEAGHASDLVASSGFLGVYWLEGKAQLSCTSGYYEPQTSDFIILSENEQVNIHATSKAICLYVTVHL